MSFRRVRLVVLFCLPNFALAQGKFEGVLTARVGTAGRGSTATYSVKGDRLRMDMTGATGVTVTMLHDASKSLDVMLMHQQKMVMDVSSMQGKGAAAVQGKKPAMKMTGKKETIAGRECEHVLITSDTGGEIDVCVAKGLGSFIMGGSMGRGRGGDAPPEVLSRLGPDAFPLKVKDPKRGVTIFEVMKVEQKSLDDRIFAIPDGYQKIDMGRAGRPMF